MTSAKLQDGTLVVAGDIDFSTVVALRQQGELLINRHAAHLDVDLSAVDSVNTAAMSLLLCWQRTANRLNVQLKYKGVPPPLRAVAEMSDLTDVLLSDTSA